MPEKTVGIQVTGDISDAQGALSDLIDTIQSIPDKIANIAIEANVDEAVEAKNLLDEFDATTATAEADIDANIAELEGAEKGLEEFDKIFADASANVDVQTGGLEEVEKSLQEFDKTVVTAEANIDTSGLVGVDKELESIADSANRASSNIDSISSKNIADVGDAAKRAGDDIEKMADNTGDLLKSILALEGMDQIVEIGNQAAEAVKEIFALTREINRIGGAADISEPAVRDLLATITTATFPVEDAEKLVKFLVQAGVEGAAAIKNASSEIKALKSATGMTVDQIISFLDVAMTLGYTIDDLPELFDAVMYAEANVLYGTETLTKIIQRMGPQFREMGLSMDQVAVIAEYLARNFGINRYSISFLSRTVREADGDIGKLEKSLGMQVGTLSRASEITEGYGKKVEEISSKNKEAIPLIDKVKDAWNDFMIRIGGVVGPLADLLGLLSLIPSAIQPVVLALIGYKLVAGESALSTSMLIAKIREFSIVSTIVGVFERLKTAIMGVTVSTGYMGAAMGVSTVQIGGFRAALSNTITSIMNFASTAKTAFVNAIMVMVGWITQLASVVKNILISAISTMVSGISRAVSALKGMNIASITKVFADLGGAIAGVGTVAAALPVAAIVAGLGIVAAAAYYTMTRYQGLRDAVNEANKAMGKINDTVADLESAQAKASENVAKWEGEVARLKQQMAEEEAQGKRSTSTWMALNRAERELEKAKKDKETISKKLTEAIKDQKEAEEALDKAERVRLAKEKEAYLNLINRKEAMGLLNHEDAEQARLLIQNADNVEYLKEVVKAYSETIMNESVPAYNEQIKSVNQYAEALPRLGIKSKETQSTMLDYAHKFMDPMLGLWDKAKVTVDMLIYSFTHPEFAYKPPDLSLLLNPFKNLPEIFKNLTPSVSSQVTALFTGGILAPVAGAEPKVKTNVDKIKFPFSDIITFFKGLPKKIYDSVLQIVENIKKPIEDRVKPIGEKWNEIKKKFLEFLEWIKGLPKRFYDEVIKIPERIKQAILDRVKPIKDAWDQAGKKFDEFLAWLGTLPAKFKKAGNDIIQKLIDGIVEKIPGLKWILDQVKKYFPSSPPEVGPLREIWEATPEFGRMLITSLASGLTVGIPDMVKILDRFKGEITAFPVPSTPSPTAGGIKQEFNITVEVTGVTASTKEEAVEIGDTIGRTAGESILEKMKKEASRMGFVVYRAV